MLPPPACGGGIGVSRMSAPGTPIVPQNGSIGRLTPAVSSVRSPAVRSNTRSAGSGNSSRGSSPKPGMMQAQPHSGSSKPRISTASASPGRAPRTAIGPASG
jgi:hypothetical protein